jgi:putative SOS response-associated peptidase YedK
MCGRYASARKRTELLEEFKVQRDRVTEPLEPDYNVAPTKPVYSVLTRRKDGEARELRVMRWGLVPSWARDVSIGSRLINARAETVSEKPAFRRAFVKRRCLLPADGYYEWQKPGDAEAVDSPARSGKGKQPYFIHRGDGCPLAFAGLYELWRDKSLGDDDPDAWLWSAAIITTSAPDKLGRIHDRMPMIIDPGSWADWLDPDNTDPGDLRSLLLPAASEELESYPVSTEVNSVRHNGPGLIERIDPAGEGRPRELAASAAPGGRRGRAEPEPAAGSDPGALF